jgi:hypothetical protein
MAMMDLSSFKFQKRGGLATTAPAREFQCDDNTFNTVSATFFGVKPKCSNSTGAGALSP